MKIVVYPHDLELGGSQLNAIEIASSVRDLGHEVTIFGRPGALVARIDELGLPFVPSPPPGPRPSPRVAVALRRLVRDCGVDVIHGYEWPPALEAHWATATSGAVSVATVMSMSVAPFIPFSMPVAVGTREILEHEARGGRHGVALVEPPVDLRANRPGLELGQDRFRAQHGISRSSVVVALVSRLAQELKLEGVLGAIEAVGSLADLPLTLLLVGDGPARPAVEDAAAKANARLGRRAVVLTGMLQDPRVAYDVSDIALGMGGSALRAMAFGKPLVVQGEHGFWELLEESSLPHFTWRGWYGVGHGSHLGPGLLASILHRLVLDVDLRLRLGELGLRLVRQHHSLDEAARRQVGMYEAARRDARRGRSDPLVEATAVTRLIRYKWHRLLARTPMVLSSDDDFNARPVASRPIGAGAQQ